MMCMRFIDVSNFYFLYVVIIFLSRVFVEDNSLVWLNVNGISDIII